MAGFADLAGRVAVVTGRPPASVTRWPWNSLGQEPTSFSHAGRRKRLSKNGGERADGRPAGGDLRRRPRGSGGVRTVGRRGAATLRPDGRLDQQRRSRPADGRGTRPDLRGEARPAARRRRGGDRSSLQGGGRADADRRRRGRPDDRLGPGRPRDGRRQRRAVRDGEERDHGLHAVAVGESRPAGPRQLHRPGLDQDCVGRRRPAGLAGARPERDAAAALGHAGGRREGGPVPVQRRGGVRHGSGLQRQRRPRSG